MRVPDRGDLAIFDTSWYRHVIDDRVSHDAKRKECEERFHEINELERMLTADRHVLVKFWMHVPKKEQMKRLRRADKDTEDFWEVTPEEWDQNDRYKEWVAATDEALERTDTEWAPWTMVECSAERRARVTVLETVAGALREEIAAVAPQLLEEPARVADGAGDGTRPPAKRRAAVKRGRKRA
jgi:polyphosphate kinase 2 (PPK2 family)